MVSKLAITIITAVGVAIGLALLILSAALPKSYWTFMVIIPLSLMALPPLFCQNKNNFGGEESCVEILGNFFLGALLACCFGLPLVLRHVDVIDDLGVALCILSIVILLGSGVAYGVHRARSEAFLG